MKTPNPWPTLTEEQMLSADKFVNEQNETIRIMLVQWAHAFKGAGFNEGHEAGIKDSGAAELLEALQAVTEAYFPNAKIEDGPLLLHSSVLLALNAIQKATQP